MPLSPARSGAPSTGACIGGNGDAGGVDKVSLRETLNFRDGVREVNGGILFETGDLFKLLLETPRLAVLYLLFCKVRREDRRYGS